MAWREWIRKRKSAIFLSVAALVLIPILYLTVHSYLLVLNFEPYRTTEAAVLFDSEGRRIGSIGGSNAVRVSSDQIPVSLRHAIISVEDRRFYTHPGIDPIGIARALWADIRAGARVQGASTITQQLSRNLFLTAEKKITRKIEEAFIALILELRFSKDQILAMYLNRIYLGSGAYGVQRAAHVYFGKSVSELTLPESAMLAALPRAPSAYDPYRHPDLARERRDLVLHSMVAAGYLSPEKAKRAAETPIRLSGRPVRTAAYFIDYVEGLLVKRLGSDLAYEGGLRVYTTLDLDVQRAAEAALRGHQGAIVAVDPGSGSLLAMEGGRDYSESQFNRATLALRQSGSAFKPFVYATALEQGWKTNSIVEDIPQKIGDYEPENYNEEYWGPVVMKQALVLSLNNAAVWLLDQVGIDAVMRTAKGLGLSHLVPADRNLALALGGLTKGVTPVEMALAYAAFANGGYSYELSAITRVIDDEGTVWWEPKPAPPRHVLSKETAYLVTDMLRGVVLHGTGRNAQLSRPVAGKTGTTNGWTDAWFIGYTPNLVAAVYVGNDDRTSLGAGGGVLAAPIWSRFAKAALQGRPATEFTIPNNVMTGVTVDVFTGKLAGTGDGCRWTVTTSFVKGTQPLTFAPCAERAAPKPPTPYRPWGTDERTNPSEARSDRTDHDADWRSVPVPHMSIEEEMDRLKEWFLPRPSSSGPPDEDENGNDTDNDNDLNDSDDKRDEDDDKDVEDDDEREDDETGGRPNGQPPSQPSSVLVP